jgi:hypothetical protein
MKSTAEPITFGRSMLREHRHVCAFFNSAAEEYDTLLPFICDGINSGQRAFHVLPAQHREDHLDWLRNAGIDVEKAMKSHQLEVALPEDTYLKTGRFDKDAMLILIQEALKNGTALGFPLTRMIAHAETAVNDWKSGNEWVEYEMRLNSVLPNYDDPVICTFDANLLTAPHAVDILRTHPMLIIGGVLVENSFFTRPHEFIREVQSRTGPNQSYRG